MTTDADDLGNLNNPTDTSAPAVPPLVPPAYAPPPPPAGAVLPYASTAAGTGLSASELYARVHWMRRNGFNSGLVLLALLWALGGPFIMAAIMWNGPVAIFAGAAISLVTGLGLLTVCIIVLTGPVYMPRLGRDGRLRTWGVANKVVAALFLVGWAVLFVRGFLASR